MARVFLCILALALASPLLAHEAHTHPGASPDAVFRSPGIGVALDAAGRLWRASVHSGQILVDVSSDLGQTFGVPVAVNATPEKIGADGELRPKIALGPQGQIYLSWTQPLAKPYSGHIRFSRSIDGGKTFSEPMTVNHDQQEITHRFDAMTVTPDGRIWVAWIDKRDMTEAKAAGRPYEGAAVYYAVSEDAGEHFPIEHKLADSSCECCRISLWPLPDHAVMALWRHVFPGGVRDHAMARITAEGADTMHRASFGGWKIDACPHHGPALARGGDWGWHMAWYDGGERPGLYYARMDGTSWVTSPQRRFGDVEAQAGHPALLTRGERVWLAWKEIDTQGASVWLAHSADGGRNWGESVAVARVTGASDYPFLIEDGRHVFLSWNAASGYRLLPLDDVK